MPNILMLRTALRDMKRYFEVLGVLIKYGFGDVVHELELDAILEKGMSLVGRTPLEPVETVPRSVRLRRVLEELGPTFIKLGQILSTRPDLVPMEWSTEFKSLQSSCSPIPFSAVRERMDAEFAGSVDTVFQSIDHQPLATASIAQVHRAVLKNGTQLLVKVLRPDIERIIESDLDILTTIAKLAEQYFSDLGYSPIAVVGEFSREIHREIDLLHEARATERFRRLFKEDPDVVFPKVYWDATRTGVLAVEEIKGILLSRGESHSLPLDERKALVANGARAIFRQCLEIGYFHADPHPGNLLALPGGKIAFIDCGMVGRIDKERMELLAELVTGVVGGDVEQVIRSVAILAEAGPEATDNRGFRTDVREFVGHFEHTPLGQLNVGMLLQEFFDKLRGHKLRCPADIVLLIKALSTIESVGRDLDPDFDVVRFAQPYVENLVMRRYSFSALKQRAERTALGYAEFLESLPSELGPLLKQLRRNKIAFNVEHRGLNRLTTTIEHASRNIGFSMIVAAMLIGCAILVLAEKNNGMTGLSTIGLIGFLAACVMVVVRALANRQRIKRD